ncbi:MAG: hypothetical protein ACFFD4_22100 [Candidatus Odinarchaeota archaeon]
MTEDELKEFENYILQSFSLVKILQFLANLYNRFKVLTSAKQLFLERLEGEGIVKLEDADPADITPLLSLNIIEKEGEKLYKINMQSYPPTIDDLSRTCDLNRKETSKALSQLVNFSLPGIYASQLVNQVVTSEGTKGFEITIEGLKCFEMVFSNLIDDIERYSRLQLELNPLKTALDMMKAKLKDQRTVAYYYYREIRTLLDEKNYHEQKEEELRQQIESQKAIISLEDLTPLYEEYLSHKKKITAAIVSSAYLDVFRDSVKKEEELIQEIHAFNGDIIELEMKISSAGDRETFKTLLEELERGIFQEDQLRDRIDRLEERISSFEKEVKQKVIELNLARSKV